MNLDTRAGRSWRRNRKKGVSPIIATILLVAITVVLAAVLYVLISGLTKGPGNTPLGSAFGWGSVGTETGTANTPGCLPTHLCYTLDIAQASSGLTAGSLTFSARSGGSPASLGSKNITLVSAAGVKTNSSWVGSGSCVSGAGTTVPCTGQLSAAMIIIIDSGGTTDTLVGDTILAVGGGSFSGSVASNSLP